MGEYEFPSDKEVNAVKAAIRKSLKSNHPDRQDDNSSSLYNSTLAHYKVILESTRMGLRGLNQYEKLYPKFGHAVEAVNVGGRDTLRRGEYAAAKVVLPRGFV